MQECSFGTTERTEAVERQKQDVKFLRQLEATDFFKHPPPPMIICSAASRGFCVTAELCNFMSTWKQVIRDTGIYTDIENVLLHCHCCKFDCYTSYSALWRENPKRRFLRTSAHFTMRTVIMAIIKTLVTINIITLNAYIHSLGKCI